MRLEIISRPQTTKTSGGFEEKDDNHSHIMGLLYI